MKTYTSTNSLFSALTSFDSNGAADIGYLGGESAIIVQSSVQSSTVFTFFVAVNGSGNYTIDYISDTRGTLSISARKFMAMTGDGNWCLIRISATINGQADTLDMFPNVKAGVSYAAIAIPRRNELDGFTNAVPAVIPPNVMIISDLFSQIIAESSLANVAIPAAERPDAVWYGVQPGYNDAEIQLSGSRNNTLQISSKFTQLIYSESVSLGKEITHTWDLVGADGCTDVVLLRWTSQTGSLRQHVFLMEALDGNVESSVQLLSVGDGYRVTKNVSRGFKVKVPNLTAYGWWYYADMLLASDLHAALPGEEDIVGTEFCAAYCADTQAAMPTGDGFYNFEATIRHRHYDTY